MLGLARGSVFLCAVVLRGPQQNLLVVGMPFFQLHGRILVVQKQKVVDRVRQALLTAFAIRNRPLPRDLAVLSQGGLPLLRLQGL